MSTGVRGSTDPTSTKTLREREFRPALTKRWRALKGAIRTTLVTNDSLSLTADAGDIRPANTFVFHNDAGAEDEFMRWLDRQLDQGVLEPMNAASIRNGEHYTGAYIRAASERGWDDAAQRLVGQGYDPEALESTFNAPVPTEQLEKAYTRTFSELEGITSESQREIRRELSDGLSQGRPNREIADGINDRVDALGIARSKTLARTEVIRSYNEQTLTRYEMAGVEEVVPEVEFLTAGDRRVCAECMSYHGSVYTVSEARGVLPLHPNCRCTWAPRVQ